MEHPESFKFKLNGIKVIRSIMLSHKEINKSKVSPSEIKKKKIGFFSSILLVIGSSIGAGIFLKNGEILNNVGGSYLLTLISWVFSIIGVICMGLALVEVSSADTNRNLGVIGWIKIFCNTFLYKCAKNYMAFISLPLCFFITPYYTMMMFQDAFGWQSSWWLIFTISLTIMLWFFAISGMSSFAGNIQNWIITSVKFIPLVFASIAGFVVVAINHKPMGSTSLLPNAVQTHTTFIMLTRTWGILGIVGSIPTIAFAFDGFYNAAGIRTEMKEPNKIPQTLLIGLLIVSIIYVLIGVSLLIGTGNNNQGKISGLDLIPHWVIAIIEILIAFGILGIINSFAIYNPRYFEDLIKIGDLPCPKKYKNKLNSNRPLVGVVYSGAFIICLFVILTFIGVFAYNDVSDYHNLAKLTPLLGDEATYGYDLNNSTHKLDNLYSFISLMSNWISIFSFLCVLFPIAGALINRRTHKIKVNPTKGFVVSAWISLIIIGLGLIFIFISAFANPIIIYSWSKDIGNCIILVDGSQSQLPYSKAEWNLEMLGSIMTLVMLFTFLLVSVIPSIFEIKHKNINNRK